MDMVKIIYDAVYFSEISEQSPWQPISVADGKRL